MLMRLIALFIFLSVLTACNFDKKTELHFKSIDFSYFDISPLSFTLRIDNQDSVFLKQNFAHDSGLTNDTSYKAVIIGGLKQQLDSLIAVINFSKLDSVYETRHIDGYEYLLYIEGDTLKKQFKVHSMNPPKELEALKELFLKIRMSFLPGDTTTHHPLNPTKTQVQGSPKRFILKDISSDKYYLADSVNRIFRQGYIGKSPLIAIDGTVFKYQKRFDTVMLPLLKDEILDIQFINKNGSEFIYGKGADNGAIIISTTKKKSTNR
jgi:hypothetical protein